MRLAHNVNSAFMMRAGWNICSKPNSLWVSVIRSKYRCDSDLLPIISKDRKGSNLWNGGAKTGENLLKMLFGVWVMELERNSS
jgi:hypothetical protein